MNVTSEVEPNTAAPSTGRRVSESSDASKDSEENPFMTLVDAAASLLDTKRPKSNTKCNVDIAPVITPSVSAIENGEDKNVQVEAPEESDTKAQIQVIKGTKEDLVVVVDGCKKLSFAEHLMAVLDDKANNDILSWMPDGKAFTITNHKKFTMDYMPKLFNIRNMSSFVRKLCRWGFQRVHEKETRNSDIFKHPFFMRGNSALVRKVKCVGRVGAGDTTTSPPSGTRILVRVTSAPNTAPLQTLQRRPESRFVYETMPSPPPRVRRVSPSSLLHQLQLAPTSPPHNHNNHIMHYTHSSSRNQNQYSSAPNLINQNSISMSMSMDHQQQHRRMQQHTHTAHNNSNSNYNLQGDHSNNLQNVHSQVVSAALETLHRDSSARSSYNNTSRNVNVNVNTSHSHRVPQESSSAYHNNNRMSLPHKAVTYEQEPSYNGNRRMPVQLQQLPYLQNAGGGNRRQTSVSWAPTHATSEGHSHSGQFFR
jgi:hypothetical protein